MFWKKKKIETPKEEQKVPTPNEKKYGVDGNFPHILLSYILIFFLACLLFQTFASQRKISSENTKLEKYIHIQEERIQNIEHRFQKDGSDDRKKDDNATINNYYYGQSPHSQINPNFETEN